MNKYISLLYIRAIENVILSFIPFSQVSLSIRMHLLIHLPFQDSSVHLNSPLIFLDRLLHLHINPKNRKISAPTNVSQTFSMQNANFCPTCNDVCLDHPTICTICGDTLVPPPVASRNSNNTRHNRISFSSPFIRSSDGGAGLWEDVPAEAMDPQQAGLKSNATNKQVLRRIPRIELDSQSAILHEATISIEASGDEDGAPYKYEMDATIGEFDPKPPYLLSGPLYLANPIHGSSNVSVIKPNHAKESYDFILYMERGGDVTFAEKAKYAKNTGAKAVLCANHVSIWPYIMKDSKGISNQQSDPIPIVMVKRSDGQIIKSILHSGKQVQLTLEAKKSYTSCIICTDLFQVKQVVLRLPLCGHVFHEDCALQWLNKHNTCPYCRRELPAEDEEYEKERRRVGRSHGGSHNDANEGTVSSEDQWSDIFG